MYSCFNPAAIRFLLTHNLIFSIFTAVRSNDLSPIVRLEIGVILSPKFDIEGMVIIWEANRTEDTLDLTRIQLDKLELGKEKGDLVKLIRKFLSDRKSDARKKIPVILRISGALTPRTQV